MFVRDAITQVPRGDAALDGENRRERQPRLEHFYYDLYPATRRTLSQYFASSTLTSDGGNLALGFTENPLDLAGELFAVRTDSAGLVGARSQIHAATPLNVVDPGLTAVATAFPVRTTIAAQGDLPARTQPTAIGTMGTGC